MFEFEKPILKFTMTRIGGNPASLPSWRLEGIDLNGKVTQAFNDQRGSSGEPRIREPREFSLEVSPKTPMKAARLKTDNRHGSGTWATFNSLPLVQIAWEHAASQTSAGSGASTKTASTSDAPASSSSADSQTRFTTATTSNTPTAGWDAAPVDFSGRWHAVDPNANYTLDLQQTEHRVTGSYDLQGGKVHGVVEGNKVTLYWQQVKNRRGGTATLTLSGDGQTMSGPWSYDPELFSSGLTGGGTWTFKRRPGFAPQPGPQDYRSLLIGDWQGARHVNRFGPDGNLYMANPGDPVYHLGTWRIEGDKLIRKYKDQPESADTIVTLNRSQLVVRDAKGTVFRSAKVAQ
jgi:hypothetical protein